MATTPFTFANTAAEDRDVAIFTKRLDTLLASATNDTQEAERLPAALDLLSQDQHLSPAFQKKLVKVLAVMNEASVANIQPEIDRSKIYLDRLRERSGWEDPANRQAQRQLASDREALENYIADLEKKRKQKAKFPTRSTLEGFTQAVEQAQLVPDIYVLALKNGFGTSATLRKILQSMLALWGFESSLAAAMPLTASIKES